MSKFLLVVGTRPEVIKMRPVFDALVAQGDEPQWCVVGQSVDLLKGFDFEDRYYSIGFDTSTYRHPLVGLHKEITAGLSFNVPLDNDWKAWVVHGDTQTAASTAMVAALAAIPVAHVEAGLRSHMHFPWPEEMNRRLIAQLASLHLAPTNTAWSNLIAEGIARGRIVMTGQTGIDALHAILKKHTWALTSDSCPRIVVTCHRRENKDRIAQLVSALKPLLSDHHITWPAHPNYGEKEHFAFPFVAPMSHDQLVGELQVADLIITDSGGVIEEAAELEKPCLIIRDETERPEALDTMCYLVPRSRMVALKQDIEALLYQRRRGLKRSSKGRFGSGHAAERVAAALRGIIP